LLQAGRPVMDADFNEQGAITRCHIRTLIRDILGPSACPEGSFAVRRRTSADQLIWIAEGHYYVGGVLVQNPSELPVPLPAPPGGKPADADYLVYLEVWDQDIGPLSEPAISDSGVVDVTTALRVRTAWRPRARRLAPELCDPDPPYGLV